MLQQGMCSLVPIMKVKRHKPHIRAYVFISGLRTLFPNIFRSVRPARRIRYRQCLTTTGLDRPDWVTIQIRSCPAVLHGWLSSLNPRRASVVLLWPSSPFIITHPTDQPKTLIEKGAGVCLCVVCCVQVRRQQRDRNETKPNDPDAKGRRTFVFRLCVLRLTNDCD